MTADSLELVEIQSQEDLRNWLLLHYAQKESVWLVTFKKTLPESYVSRDQVLDELVSFGWIDGIRKN